MLLNGKVNNNALKFLLFILVIPRFLSLSYGATTFPSTIVPPGETEPMEFEKYIKHAVGAEMGYSGYPLEASKALAVAARCISANQGSGTQAFDPDWDVNADNNQNNGCSTTAGQDLGLRHGSHFINAYHFSHDLADKKGRPDRTEDGIVVTNDGKDVGVIGNEDQSYLKRVPSFCFKKRSIIETSQNSDPTGDTEQRGHGAGLCQWGAWGMAESNKPNGSKYTAWDILHYYYTLEPYVKKVEIKQGTKTIYDSSTQTSNPAGTGATIVKIIFSEGIKNVIVTFGMTNPDAHTITQQSITKTNYTNDTWTGTIIIDSSIGDGLQTLKIIAQDINDNYLDSDGNHLNGYTSGSDEMHQDLVGDPHFVVGQSFLTFAKKYQSKQRFSNVA